MTPIFRWAILRAPHLTAVDIDLSFNWIPPSLSMSDDLCVAMIVLAVFGGYVFTSLLLLRYPTLLHQKKKLKLKCRHISHRGGELGELQWFSRITVKSRNRKSFVVQDNIWTNLCWVTVVSPPVKVCAGWGGEPKWGCGPSVRKLLGVCRGPLKIGPKKIEGKMVFWGQKDLILRGFVPKRSFLCWWMRKNTPKRSSLVPRGSKKGVKTAAHMYHPSYREYPPRVWPPGLALHCYARIDPRVARVARPRLVTGAMQPARYTDTFTLGATVMTGLKISYCLMAQGK